MRKTMFSIVGISLALSLTACSEPPKPGPVPTEVQSTAVDCEKYSTNLIVINTQVTLGNDVSAALQILINKLRNDGLMNGFNSSDPMYILHRFMQTDFASQCLSAETADYFNYLLENN